MAKENYDLEIDVEAPRGRVVVFFPAHRQLRSTLRPQPGENSDILLIAGGEIPGQRILIDTKLRHVKIIDRMGLKENEERARQIREAIKSEKYPHLLNTKLEAEPDIDLDVDIKKWPEWLYHLANLEEQGRLKVRKGKLLTRNECLKMCNYKAGIRVQLSESGGLRDMNQDRPFYFLDERDAEVVEATAI